MEQNVLPQKRYMEGAIHTLVDAVVSSSTHTENNTKSPRQPTHAIPTQAPATGITKGTTGKEAKVELSKFKHQQISKYSLLPLKKMQNPRKKTCKRNSIPSVIGAQEPPQEVSPAEEATSSLVFPPSTKPLITEPESSSVQTNCIIRKFNNKKQMTKALLRP
ncbi:CPS_collapsed_G0003620.mRNA.1.CDS.1 [Saccharomyces cerevisiae]|nr:CPS_collapsed_G0003620.mRNA.1.CDS.1 [Saccharomyces cerevisiae]